MLPLHVSRHGHFTFVVMRLIRMPVVDVLQSTALSRNIISQVAAQLVSHGPRFMTFSTVQCFNTLRILFPRCTQHHSIDTTINWSHRRRHGAGGLDYSVLMKDGCMPAYAMHAEGCSVNKSALQGICSV